MPDGFPLDAEDKLYYYGNYVVVATNVIEESITMFDVDYVIDTGYELLVSKESN
jgi:hypothetical protein